MSGLDLSRIAYCKIFPPIGIARVGDSEEEDGYFFVPEVPGAEFEAPEGPVPRDVFRYRDRFGKVKRQAARFRLYAFDTNDTLIGEVTDAHADITWTATLANKKAAWFGFFGAAGARSAFRGEEPTRDKSGDPLKLRNPTVGMLYREAGGPHGHHYVPSRERAEALEIVGAERSIAGPGRRHPKDIDASEDRFDFIGTFKHGTQVYLGELATDAGGRLIVLGGRGVSAPVDDHGKPLAATEDKWIVHYANNNDWHDDVSDGPITASVHLKGAEREGSQIEVRGGAWVIVAPPDFAPDITNLVTLYDVMEEVAIEAPHLVNPTTPPLPDPTKLDLERDIWPIAGRAAGYRWVSRPGLRGHGQGKPGDMLGSLPETFEDFVTSLERGKEGLRDHFVQMVRPPTYESPSGYAPSDEELAAAEKYANATYMPPLAGDEGDCETGKPKNWLSVTYSQFRRLQAWCQGELFPKMDTPPLATFLDDQSLHPAILTRAILERCAGGAFYPGIEATAITRDPKLYSEAFRFDHDVLQPGDITKYMACPWQADFYECRDWWWPAQRPDEVVLEESFKKIFAEFKAEQTGDLAGTFERTLMDRGTWHRGVGEASPRPSDSFVLGILFPLSKSQREQETAEAYAARIAQQWASRLTSAGDEDSPWRRQYLVQEELDAYSGRYYHLRAGEPSDALNLSRLRSKYTKLFERFDIQSLDDLQNNWGDAEADIEAQIADALTAIQKLCADAMVASVAKQIATILLNHPDCPEQPGAPGTAAALHDALTNTKMTVDQLDQDHPEEVRLGTLLHRRYAALELRDAMRDRTYLANMVRNGDNGMVNDWRRLGFVVARTVALGDGKPLTVQIETERGRYDGMSPRDQFYALLNIQDFADFPAESINIVESGLSYAQTVIDSLSIDDPLHPESFVPYDDVAFRAKLDEIYEILRGRARGYDLYFALRVWNRDAAVRRMLDSAPFNQCDGAWLRHIAEAGPSDEVRSMLFEIWSDEIGNGDPALHHGNLFTALLESLGKRLPAVTTRAYADYQDIPPESYIMPVFELAISLNSDRFYPELLGMTLFLEWEVLSLQTTIIRYDYLGIDSQFWRMHVGIDNATNGHGAKARDAVITYLDKIRQEGGDAAVQAQWARIWRGFVAFDVVGANMYGNTNDTDIARRRPGTPADKITEIMTRKRPYGSQNHLTDRMGPHRINDLFEDPDLFQSVLANSRWVIPGDPDKSPFINYLTTFAGPMYKIFDAADIAAWRAWIEWLGCEGDTASTKRYYDKGQAMEKLLQELRSTGEAVAAHRRYQLGHDAPNGQHAQTSIAAFFAEGDIPAMMRALRDPANGWIVPGSPADSALVADIARGGRPMGNTLDKRFAAINNRIGRQIIIEWVRAGCPLPGEPIPGQEDVAKPLKSLGPKLLLHLLGPGAVH
ncbi:LodA/GoxA family CTQ-dependent oxidase [Xanthobacter aminoxidans]|uniref:LodA/GoxA family CTQ-dependent oxidase n=1 Tax=Xanthobacter aminoxidans TaxID=186280 RepID=UPI00372AEA71